MKHSALTLMIPSLLVIVLSASLPVHAKTTVKDEIDIGRETAAEIEKRFPVTDNQAWLQDINKLGSMLTPNVKRKEIPYSFKIIKEKTGGKNEIDAFSLPGGPIYFSERMWALLSRDERIGVLAHEIAHVDKRHAIDTLSEMQRRSLWATAILIITGTRSQSVWDITGLANQLYTLKYSRKRETEADMMGVDLVHAVGESPAGLVTAMKKIMRLEGESGSGAPKILSTHPQTKDRVDYLTKRCIELGVKPEAMELRFRDDPDRLGQVTGKSKRGNTLTLSTTRDLLKDERVAVKKPLWDETADALVLRTVATGTVTTPGTSPQISIKMVGNFEPEDIAPGDGVYPDASASVAPDAKPQ